MLSIELQEIANKGEGIFPSGILVGTIQSIGNDEYNNSIFASIKPFCDIENLREIMVITEFNGQGEFISVEVE